MRVAVFSDVHANLIALEQFVRSTKDVVDEYLCLGDVVNYGPWNDECIDVVMNLPGITILEGNHERLFLGTDDVTREIPLVQDFFHHSNTFFSNRDLISDLPKQCQLGQFECIHSLGDYSIYPNTSIDITCNHMIGHSHHQFKSEHSGYMLVNPGSIGQNRKWIDMLDYLVIDLESQEIQMQSKPYDFNLFLSELYQRHYPKNCIAYYANKPRINS